MANLWKKAAACFLAAAMLSGGGPELCAKAAGTPEVITAASETGRAKTAEAAGEISVVRKGNILLLSGKGALTKEALKNMDFSGSENRAEGESSGQRPDDRDQCLSWL